MSKSDLATTWMENLANDDSHGYDQIYRWGERGDYDCSSAIITAWKSVGVPLTCTYTGNMKKDFLANGFKDVTDKVNRATGFGMLRGDVLLNELHHVAMYCGNGYEVEASINEKGTATGGKPGDQTGREIRLRTYRNYPWDCVLRYSSDSNNADITNENVKIALEVISGKWGNGDARKEALAKSGYKYETIQGIVNKLLRQYDSNIKVAKDVIKGNYGVGEDRVRRLTAAGYDARFVQCIVNCIILDNLDI